MSTTQTITLPELPENFDELSLDEMAEWLRVSAATTALASVKVRDAAGRSNFGRNAARFATKAEEVAALAGPWMTP